MPLPFRALAALLLLAAPAPAQEAPPVGGHLGAPAAEGVTELAGAEALDRLVAVLEDEGARAALLAALAAARGGTVAELGAEAGTELGAEPAAGAPALDLVGRAAAGLGAAASEVAAEARAVAAELGRLGDLGERLRAARVERGPEVGPLLVTILGTVAASLAFGGAASLLTRRLRPPQDATATTRAGAALGALAVRLGALGLAWGAGHALAGLLFPGAPSAAQALYLRAFLAFGLARLALRAFADPDADREPALSPLPPPAQATVHRSLRLVAGVVVHGFLFVVPLAQSWAGFAVARPVRTLVATSAALLALVAVWRIRGALRAMHPPAGGLGAAWRALWPPLALLYVGYAWLVAVTRPALLGPVVLWGTVNAALALAVLLGALHLLRRLPAVRAPLPPAAAAALPALPPRADAIAKALAAVAAMAAVAGAVLLAAAGWGWADVPALLARPRVQGALLRLASALLVLLAAATAWALVASAVDARLAAARLPPGRARTLLGLFRNAFGVAVAVLALMVALAELGLDIAPLLAGAGVVGLAVGFGAQRLVQDVITGVFIQLENAMDLGDVVTVAGVSGSVEGITIRSVRVRALDGAQHVIPFSSVTTVANLSRDYGIHVAEVALDFRASVSDAKAAMRDAFDRLLREPEGADVEGPLDLQGVVAMREGAVVVRALVRTRPGRQWDAGRRYSELLHDALEARGVAVAPRLLLSGPPA